LQNHDLLLWAFLLYKMYYAEGLRSVFRVLRFRISETSKCISVSLTVYWLFYVWFWIGYGLVLVWKGI